MQERISSRFDHLELASLYKKYYEFLRGLVFMINSKKYTIKTFVFPDVLILHSTTSDEEYELSLSFLEDALMRGVAVDFQLESSVHNEIAHAYGLSGLIDFCRLTQNLDSIPIFTEYTDRTPIQTSFFRSNVPLSVLAQLLPVRDDALHILEIGCSLGCETYSLLAACQEQQKLVHITAIDSNLDTIRVAREFQFQSNLIEELRHTERDKLADILQYSGNDRFVATKYAKDHITFVVHDISKSPMKNGTYGAILCANVLCHVPRLTRIRIVENAIGTLEKNGYLVFEERNREMTQEYYDWLTDIPKTFHCKHIRGSIYQK